MHAGVKPPLIDLSFGFLGVALRRPPYAVLAVRLRWGAGFALGLLVSRGGVRFRA